MRRGFIQCSVCRTRFKALSINRYEVKLVTTAIQIMFKPPGVYEAFTCPVCGCQVRVNEFYSKVEE